MFSSFTGSSKKQSKGLSADSQETRQAQESAKAKKIIADQRAVIKGPMEQVNSRQNNSALRYGCMGGVGLSGAILSYLAAQRLPALGSVGTIFSLFAAMYGGPFLHNTYVDNAKMEAAKQIDSSMQLLEEVDTQTGQLIPEYYQEIEVLRRMRSEIAPEGSPVDLAVRGTSSSSSAMGELTEQLREMAEQNGGEPTVNLSQSEILDLRIKKIVSDYESEKMRRKAIVGKEH